MHGLMGPPGPQGKMILKMIYISIVYIYKRTNWCHMGYTGATGPQGPKGDPGESIRGDQGMLFKEKENKDS